MDRVDRFREKIGAFMRGHRLDADVSLQHIRRGNENDTYIRMLLRRGFQECQAVNPFCLQRGDEDIYFLIFDLVKRLIHIVFDNQAEALSTERLANPVALPPVCIDYQHGFLCVHFF